MSPCAACGGAGHVEGAMVRCRRCDKRTHGKTKWDAIYAWNCLNPGMTTDQRIATEWFSQHPKEFREMCELIDKGPILEIGSRYGQALIRMAKRLPKGSRVVAVDLGQDPYSPNVDTEHYLRITIKELLEAGYDAHLVLGDSHAAETIEKVRALGPYAFAFIDGEHTAAGVKADYEAYGPMTEVIAFHDIRNNHDMDRFWNAVRGEEWCEYVHSNMGIGVKWKEAVLA